MENTPPNHKTKAMNIQDYKKDIQSFIVAAFKEDVGDGDHTSNACVPENEEKKAKLLVKQEGILAGVELTQWLLEILAPKITFEGIYKDGDKVKYGDIAFYLQGNARKILTIERLILNFMQRMSGIATNAHRYASIIKDLHTKVLDTRKTTPGLRIIEKWAVAIGGGSNHRLGLHDLIMIKDNHIDYAGGIEKAINNTHKYLNSLGKSLKIEIEVRDLKELETVLSIGQIDRIMLDNFSPKDTLTAVKKIDGKYETESSGGITLDTIRSYAECSVDFVSVGALTHQIKSLDLSLKAC